MHSIQKNKCRSDHRVPEVPSFKRLKGNKIGCTHWKYLFRTEALNNFWMHKSWRNSSSSESSTMHGLSTLAKTSVEQKETSFDKCMKLLKIYGIESLWLLINCLIYQQVLCESCFDLSCVMNQEHQLWVSFALLNLVFENVLTHNCFLISVGANSSMTLNLALASLMNEHPEWYLWELSSLRDEENHSKSLALFWNWLLMLLAMSLALLLNKRPNGSEYVYLLCAHFFFSAVSVMI